MAGSPPSYATAHAFTFPTFGNDDTTRAISPISNMHETDVMNVQNDHSPTEDPNDSKANDSIPLLPDDEALFLNISLNDPTPQAKVSAQWKEVPSKAAKNKIKVSPSASPTAAIGENVTMKQPRSPTNSFGSLSHMDISPPSTPPQTSVVATVRIPLPTLHHTSLDTPLANGAHKAARHTNKKQQQLCFPTILHLLGKAASTAKQQLLGINKATVGKDSDIPSTAKTNQTNGQEEQTIR